MPWRIERRNKKYCVIKEDDGTNQGCHETREAAKQQLKALYATEAKKGLRMPRVSHKDKMLESIVNYLTGKKNDEPEEEDRFVLVEKSEKERVTLGIVYAPDKIDLQGDFADETEIAKACHSFNLGLQGRTPVEKALMNLGEIIIKEAKEGEVRLTFEDGVLAELEKRIGLNLMHINKDDDEQFEVLESYIAPCDMIINNHTVTKGTWLLKARWPHEIFAKIEAGEFRGYSLEGTGLRMKMEEAA